MIKILNNMMVDSFDRMIKNEGPRTLRTKDKNYSSSCHRTHTPAVNANVFYCQVTTALDIIKCRRIISVD